MRIVLLPLLLFALQSQAAKTMFVVVHSSDKVLEEFVCENRRVVGSDAPVARQVLRAQGRLAWHVVGGVPPYTVISQESDGFGSLCITVMDMTGTMATGCGMVQVRTVRTTVNCPDVEAQDEQIRVDEEVEVKPLRAAGRYVAPREEPAPSRTWTYAGERNKDGGRSRDTGNQQTLYRGTSSRSGGSDTGGGRPVVTQQRVPGR